MVVCIALMLCILLMQNNMYHDLSLSRLGTNDGFTPRDPNIVAYYQSSGHNRVAQWIALSLFRQVYPFSPLYIHFDINKPTNETEALSKRFTATLTTYNSQSSDHSTASHGMYFTVDASIRFIQRLQAAAGMRPNGWVLLLEDDVWVWGKPDARHLFQYDINGHCWLRFDQTHSHIIQAHASPKLQVYKNATCYGASGGSILNSSRLIGLDTSLQSGMREFVGNLSMRSDDVASDLLISAVILRDGGSIGWYKGYYDFVVVGYGIPKIMHHMKMFYFMKYFYG